VKIFHADDLASDERVADAIRYASRNADILSCSWSGGTSPDVELALRDAAETGRNGLGTAVFCASGNDARNIVGFPASDPHAIAVGASTDKGEIADYSNRGPELSICAPSSGGTHGIYTTDVSILNRGFNLGDSTDKKGLFTDSFGGTSSATPLAAGVGALLLSVNPELSSVQLRERLESTADKIGSPEDYDGKGHSNTFGYGRVNAEKALG
jgi:subtilisin family serine protease